MQLIRSPQSKISASPNTWALSGAHRKNWRQACIMELDQMAVKDFWVVVKKNLNMKTIGHRWVFDLKRKVKGSIERFKAQLVACGDRQQPGLDFMETGAYLYILVDENVLIKTPVVFLPELQLKKALYGMRQVGRCWWKRHIKTFKNVLCAELNIKWLDMEQQLVGLKCEVGKGEVTITQRRLTDSILDTYLRQVLRHDLPLPVLPVGTQIPDAKVLDPTTFCSVIGSLDYLVGGSRPYLAFAINYLVCHSMGPTMENWELLDHVIGYLLSTHNCGIQLRLGNLSLTLWSDAGWGGDLKRSQIGFIIPLGEAPILWGSKRQTVVALSTCAAEYVALSDSTQHLVQAINQVTQLAGNFNKAIFYSNQAVVYVSISNKTRKHMQYLTKISSLLMIPL
ncbi:hypothetical protein O181_013349 [Austropuccinia psidii MF-1]|uniref:Reverse transcriptase Ty1/copia-type domain-containing protein n=1 Tax=Austropuccinia psidii MF-1 TaxID=1389203 RepID=A0A9Q3GNS0_9BASI|nr:hypothetical protein [Austropuccinia psidii MF-1]